MSDNVKTINRRQTLALTGALTALAGAALWTGARADESAAKPGPAIDDLAAADLVGYVLRVIEPGQVVTMEYNPGRVTVVVDANKQITRIYIG